MFLEVSTYSLGSPGSVESVEMASPIYGLESNMGHFPFLAAPFQIVKLPQGFL
jgi:hypothetical protein